MPKRIKIKVVPRSSADIIVGKMADGILKVKLRAAPVDGKANQSLLRLLSKRWNTSKNKLKIVKGLTSRNKIIEILD